VGLEKPNRYSAPIIGIQTVGIMPNDLDRFVEAQVGVFECAIKEITAGKKRTHWMWFVFPQLRGLGQSEKSHIYGITGLKEARSYLSHPLLGPRLQQATGCVLEVHTPRSEVFGAIDQQKFVSCMTLFSAASLPDSIFNRALHIFSVIDKRTVEMLGEEE